ncbi:S41 family peptidase [Actinophytocola algeriensis]|uniref:Tail specific protease domain-containing protein n=1 Tax=Actinophytocola algeriensis TaxID=1768010 RepID=A0A7W7Q3D8_9PSEU|nr:S41 family peptidase [Actinophytocola algeriensis]MBB4906093.1 hypothetical protein [Actinophytocola algeriensis]MBE1472222.1 hypothetical protein [Actinophytocola algeriensis]
MRRMVGALAVVVLLLGVGGDATARGVPMSHAAYDYLESALTLLQDKALDRYTVDWRKIRGDAFEMARDASEPADTYSAIRGAIATIGNRHTRLIPPGEAVPPPAARIPVPEGELLYGRFAQITIPGIQADQAGEERYVSAGQAAVRTLDAAAPCGWLVDLRADEGGNMWPMLTVLAPLLGDGRLGSFVGPDGRSVHWEIRGDDVVLGGQVVGTNPVRLTRPAPPVAVLTSQYTGSAGEGTLVSFLGLDRVRTFGLRTAGLSTANEPYELSDGAILVLTVATMADRTGRRYGTPIEPDVPASPRTGADVAAATTWLADQPGCT